MKTKEEFQDFIDRLRFHNKGKGVDWHYTANPIFLVRNEDRKTGIDMDCCNGTLWYYDDLKYESTDEIIEDMDADELQKLLSILGISDEAKIKEEENDDLYAALDELGYNQTGYVDEWVYVCAHFTKEAAEAFIERKKHDYRKLAVYVDSQFRCPEFNAVIDALLTGKIIWNEA
ncbi:hypothetical protein [Desulforegula conservatrix]|uniref:hypothetical protein n=1 Tax=Desulforegula conservatrix TaxID=153026 RepID=UPI0003F6B00E|nr:hypothetical protein [Desulforegula conservatrix]